VLVVATFRHVGEAEPEGRIARHHPNHLVEGQLREEFARFALDLVGCQRCAGFEHTESRLTVNERRHRRFL
jgi:hypothetical protein